MLFEKCVDHSLKFCQRFSANKWTAVDKESWRAGNTEIEAVPQVFGHVIMMASRIQTGYESIQLKSKFLRQRDKVPLLSGCLPVKQDIMILPKFVLLSCAEGGFGGMSCMRMVGAWKISIDNADSFTVKFSKLLQDAHTFLTVGALKV